jgi:hypothetical protein
MYEDDEFSGEQLPRARRKLNKVKPSFRRDREGHGGKRGSEYTRGKEKEEIRNILDEWEEEVGKDLEDDEGKQEE